jgi:protein TonB
MQKRDNFSRFVVTSAGLHVGVVALVFVAPSLLPARASDTWGSKSGNDGGIRVGVVASLPGIELPSPPVVQENVPPSESETLHPSEPAPKNEPRVEEKPAVLIASKTAKPKPAPAPARGATKTKTDAPVSPPSNAIPGEGGQPAVPYGQPGAGGQTTFSDEAFGLRYGWYVENMTRAIREKWQPGAVRVSSPRFYVAFTIARDGKVTNFRIDQSSGNAALDSAAETAVTTAAIPKLPGDYLRPSIEVRFYFEYAR